MTALGNVVAQKLLDAMGHTGKNVISVQLNTPTRGLATVTVEYMFPGELVDDVVRHITQDYEFKVKND